MTTLSDLPSSVIASVFVAMCSRHDDVKRFRKTCSRTLEGYDFAVDAKFPVVAAASNDDLLSDELDATTKQVERRESPARWFPVSAGDLLADKTTTQERPAVVFIDIDVIIQLCGENVQTGPSAGNNGAPFPANTAVANAFAQHQFHSTPHRFVDRTNSMQFFTSLRSIVEGAARHVVVFGARHLERDCLAGMWRRSRSVAAVINGFLGGAISLGTPTAVHVTLVSGGRAPAHVMRHPAACLSRATTGTNESTTWPCDRIVLSAGSPSALSELFVGLSSVARLSIDASLVESGFTDAVSGDRADDKLRCVPSTSFMNCPALTHVTFRRHEQLLEAQGASATQEHDVNERSLFVLGANCFRHCTSLRHLMLGADAVLLAEIHSRALEGTALEVVDLSNCQHLRSIGHHAFAKSQALREVKLAGCVALERIDAGAFEMCHELERLTIASSAPSLRVLAMACFAGSGIVSLELSNLRSLTSIDDFAFRQCLRLERVRLSDLPALQRVGSGAFARCPALTDVIFGPNLSSLAALGAGAFEGCAALESITLSERATPRLVHIADRCFADCALLTTVDLAGVGPRNAMLSIGRLVFDGCHRLRVESVRFHAAAAADEAQASNASSPTAGAAEVGRQLYAQAHVASWRARNTSTGMSAAQLEIMHQLAPSLSHHG